MSEDEKNDLHVKKIYNDKGELVEILYIQDIYEILKHNYEQKKCSEENWDKDKDVKYVGRIPITDWWRLQDLGITEDDKALEKAIELNQQWKATNKKL